MIIKSILVCSSGVIQKRYPPKVIQFGLTYPKLEIKLGRWLQEPLFLKKYEWENNQVLQYEFGNGIFGYLETGDAPEELDEGLVTENGYFWKEGRDPVKICSIMVGELCTSYDEEPFRWTLFKGAGQGFVQFSGDQISFVVPD